ncbi:hypothetical protein DEO72_LG8g841 [Vigna unguiculata]|uniref:Uncharacterized protein n=1 Tax=Vigna unguiculata TaxID=3917 RepID=A0A4D6MMV7_VIGUN|nr:hypothetical protein DEO72_LG8g841 [Vigna unguiculata]
MDTNMFQSDDSRKYYCPVLGSKVFVQGSNLRCLTAVSNILQALGYEVMTANNSIELFGSELHLQKPLKISDLSSLWKYTLWRMEDRMVITADVEGFGMFESEEIIVNNNRECRSFMNTGGQTLQGVIIREHNHTREGNKSESLMLGRKRLSRTYDSHAELAGTSASPNQRNQLRNVPGFEIQNIESHFQNEPYSVSRYTSDSDEFMNNVSGDQRAENTIDGKVFSEDTCIYCVDDISVQSEMEFNTLSSNDMCHRMIFQYKVKWSLIHFHLMTCATDFRHHFLFLFYHQKENMAFMRSKQMKFFILQMELGSLVMRIKLLSGAVALSCGGLCGELQEN